MASPIYFFPQTRVSQVVANDRLVQSFLDARGVAAAFAGVKSVSQGCSCFELTGSGPGGHSGVLIHVLPGGKPPLRLEYSAKFQAWHEKPAGADCWVGIDNEYPPTPADLARGPHLSGYDVELADGNTWRVPIVRSPQPSRECGDRDFCFDTNGRAYSVRTGDERLWQLAEVVWDHYIDTEADSSVGLDDLLEFCIGTLSMNYRFGKPEQHILRLIKASNWQAVADAALDIPLLKEAAEAQKKTTDSSALV
jgi:hypothetical protein